MVNESIRVLEMLIGRNTEVFSINRISKLRSVNYKTAYLIVEKLRKLQLIRAERIGNTIACSFGFKSHPLVYEAEILRRSEFLAKSKSLSVLYAQLLKVKNPFFCALLFGSYAKGSQAKASDIDLAVVCSDELYGQLSKEILILPLKLHLLHFKAEEFIAALKTKEFNVCHEIKKNNIILFGIENYYEVLRLA